jgi:hypothetical protein
MYERGRLLSNKEIDAKAAVVGELMTYECPREPGGEMRPMASLHTPTGQLLKPIIGPRMTAIGHSAFTLRGLEELKTERGWVYVVGNRRAGRAERATMYGAMIQIAHAGNDSCRQIDAALGE